MDEYSKLWTLSSQLLNLVQQAEQVYEKVRSTKEKGNFYTEVKPFADHVKLISDQWKEEAEGWIVNEKPKHIHKQQIAAAIENLQIIAVQAFFPETSYSRFKQTIYSVEYILKEIKRNLDDGHS